ncbi:hypothetical protein WMY93_024270 [Mugilogobius chulae]|uniref:Uncharacterized protein n=1 Tax=Mugilogobius chulae TaxID=88201 RepID=A0AAW0N9G2_9GOBI
MSDYQLLKPAPQPAHNTSSSNQLHNTSSSNQLHNTSSSNQLHNTSSSNQLLNQLLNQLHNTSSSNQLHKPAPKPAQGRYVTLATRAVLRVEAEVPLSPRDSPPRQPPSLPLPLRRFTIGHKLPGSRGEAAERDQLRDRRCSTRSVRFCHCGRASAAPPRSGPQHRHASGRRGVVLDPAALASLSPALDSLPRAAEL